MSSNNPTRLWELMSKYTFHVDESDSLKEDVTCIICKKLIIDAFHSYCGCKYCHKCITEYLSQEARFCPGNNTECQDEYLAMEKNVTRNIRTNRQILKLNVKCPNESCEFKTELFHMEEHIRVCQKQAVKCPYIILGCEEEKAPKDFITNHLNEDVFIHSDVLIKYIMNLKNEFDNLKIDCDISKDEIISLKEESYKKEVRMKEQDDEIELLKNHSKLKTDDLQKEIILLKEEYDKVENMKQEINCLSERLEKCELDKQSLKEELQENKVEVEKLKKEIISLKEESKKVENMKQKVDCLSEVIENCRLNNQNLKEELEQNKVEGEELRKEIVSIQTEFKKMGKNIEEIILKKEDKKIVEKCEKVQNIAEWIKCPNFNVDFIWKIDQISLKKNQRLFSEPFYSNNYKLRLYYYYYYGSYSEDYLGFCIMRGDNDDRAEWPLRLSVTLSTMNQVSLRPQRSETLKYDTLRNKGGFERPKSKENSVIETEISENDHSLSVFEDSLIIYCVVTPP